MKGGTKDDPKTHPQRRFLLPWLKYLLVLLTLIFRVCFNEGLKKLISFLGPETQQERLKTIWKILMVDFHIMECLQVWIMY
ncbi:hypothetical protein SLEP1_g55933 [Rubroshorea leprosula]|uniref:Uncharacterized protein n=1 Tax=Rubroshorea leprosula TaxID=152421 RepID=A0AAV5MI49_9ROSI|nr:hypothetical protein SLEP1_g55933 [Rubroshorea leprosula]